MITTTEQREHIMLDAHLRHVSRTSSSPSPPSCSTTQSCQPDDPLTGHCLAIYRPKTPSSPPSSPASPSPSPRTTSPSSGSSSVSSLPSRRFMIARDWRSSRGRSIDCVMGSTGLWRGRGGVSRAGAVSSISCVTLRSVLAYQFLDNCHISLGLRTLTRVSRTKLHVDV